MTMKPRIFIQMGPGGVGKTTVSAAFGFYWASQGKRVLVLTIDPSRRLAQALGIQGQKGAARVPFEGLKGELHAMVLDHGEIFDSFVKMAAKKNPLVNKLLSNKLYIALKTQLQGSQDFTALIELYHRARSGDYDVIVLDTPPAEHAWQFLEAPLRLMTLFQDKIAKWFRWIGDEDHTIWSRVISTGTRQVFKVLELLTGSEFIQQIGDFFKSIHYFQDQLRDQIKKSHDLLKDDQTEFTIVTTQDELKILESLEHAREIKSKGYHLRRVIMNRAWPEDGETLHLEGFSEEQGLQIRKLLTLLSANQKTAIELMSRWPQDVRVMKIYDTLKSSHDLEKLKEMSDDMMRAFE